MKEVPRVSSTEAMPANTNRTAQAFLNKNRPTHRGKIPPPRLMTTPATLARLSP